MGKNANTVPPLCQVAFTALAGAFSLALAAPAADLYVSHLRDANDAPYYAGAPADATVYASLADAVAATAKSGDTIWVEDGYVCDSGATSSYRIYVTKAMTIRSRSGRWETGATIVGDASTGCVGVSKTGGGASQVNGDLRLVGFTLRDSGKSYGGIYVADGWARFDMENCLVCGMTGGNGIVYDRRRDEVAQSTVRHCVFTGNVNSNALCCVVGGSVYDTLFTYNWGGSGGSCYSGGTTDTGCVVSNCVFLCNTNHASNAGGAVRAQDSAGSFKLMDCRFERNTFSRNITYGAAFRGYGTVSNCVFIGNGHSLSAYTIRGDGNLGVRVFDCAFTGNFASGPACVQNVWATNTTFVANTTGAANLQAGCCYQSILVDCDLVCNTNNYSGTASECVLVDCRILGNRTYRQGGGAFRSVLTNCVVAGNNAYGTGSTTEYGAGGGLSACFACNCVITNNIASMFGGGTSGGTNVNCLIAGNVARMPTSDQSVQDRGSCYGMGGGAYESRLVGCVVSNNTAWYRGGGFYGSTETINCRFEGNATEWDQNWIGAYANGGSAVWGGTHYNALMTGNRGVGAYGGTVTGWSGLPAVLIGCTVVGNASEKASGGIAGTGDASMTEILVNTIVAGNTGAQADKFTAATNSYVAVAGATGVDSGCLYGTAPKLGTVAGFDFMPLPGSPCIGKGAAYAYQLDSTDPRSRDVWGRRRVVGAAPDIGAVEAKDYATVFSVK